MESGEPPEDGPTESADPLRPHHAAACASGIWGDFAREVYFHFKGETPTGFRDVALLKYAGDLFDRNGIDALDGALQDVAETIMKGKVPCEINTSVTGYVATMIENALKRSRREGTQLGWSCRDCGNTDVGPVPDRCPLCDAADDWYEGARVPMMGDEGYLEESPGNEGTSSRETMAADALGIPIGASIDPHRRDSTDASLRDGQWNSLIDAYTGCRDKLLAAPDQLFIDIAIWGAYNHSGAPLSADELRVYLPTPQGRTPVYLKNRTPNFPLLQHVLNLGHLNQAASKKAIRQAKDRIKKRLFPCMEKDLAKAGVTLEELGRFF